MDVKYWLFKDLDFSLPFSRSVSLSFSLTPSVLFVSSFSFSLFPPSALHLRVTVCVCMHITRNQLSARLKCTLNSYIKILFFSLQFHSVVFPISFFSSNSEHDICIWKSYNIEICGKRLTRNVCYSVEKFLIITFAVTRFCSFSLSSCETLLVTHTHIHTLSIFLTRFACFTEFLSLAIHLCGAQYMNMYHFNC